MGGKNSRQKFKDRMKYIPLNPMMPKQYNAEERKKLRAFEQEIMKASNNNIGKEPGE